MSDELARRVRSRTARAVPITGPPGCGKSKAIALALSADDVASVHVFAHPRRGTLALFARDLADALAPLCPRLALGYAGAIAHATRRDRPATELANWFASELKTARLTIALDDLHLLGADTFAFVARIVERSASDIVWILGSRNTHAWPLASWLARSIACIPIALGAAPFVPEEHAYDAAVRTEARLWLATLCEEDRSIARALVQLPGTLAENVRRLPGAHAIVSALRSAHPYAIASARLQTTFGVHVLDSSRDVHDDALARALDALPAEHPELRLRLLTEYGDARAIAAGLDEHGFALLDSGRADFVDDAIRRLTSAESQTSAVALALEAKRESERGRYDVSESWYLHAIAIAPNAELKARIQWAFASDLLRRSRSDAVDILERIAGESSSVVFRAMTAAALGAAYAALDRMPDALGAISTALRSTEGWSGNERLGIRALVYRQAAYVYLCDRNRNLAARYADLAIDDAERCGLHELVAAALSVLVVVASSYDDDAAAALVYLQRLERSALWLDNAYLLRYARLAQLDIFGDRGSWTEVDRLETLLAEQELENDLVHADETLVRIRALRAAGNGQFTSAVRLLESCGEHGGPPELRALRHAEIATYAAAAGMREPALQARFASQQLLDEIPHETTDAVAGRTQTLLTLVDALIGNRSAARGRLAGPSRSRERFSRIGILETAVRRIVEFDEAPSDRYCMALLEAFSALHACGFGGIAVALGALPVSSVTRRAS